MTITSQQVSLTIDQPDVDQRPGSSDIAWAERAYHHHRIEPVNRRRRLPRAGRRRRMRLLVATLILLMSGLIVTMRYEGSPAATVPELQTTWPAATAPQPTADSWAFTLSPPLLRPFPSLSPTVDIAKE